MIEDLIELENKGYILDPIIREAYYELCMENSRFCGQTMIDMGMKGDYWIDIIDFSSTNTYPPYYIYMLRSGDEVGVDLFYRQDQGPCYHIDINKKHMIVRRKDLLKSTILQYFKETVEKGLVSKPMTATIISSFTNT